MTPLVLLTDFGLTDHYVGVMHAVLVREAPKAARIDLGHGIPPGDVWAGAVALKLALPWLPEPCVVVAVVDPGVGTSRRALAVQVGSRWIVGPDNGLLSACGTVDEAYEIVPTRVAAQPPSATFHGRDLFAPVAGRLARGVSVERLARPVGVGSLRGSPLPEAVRKVDGWSGAVLSVDVFGNVVTNIPAKDLPGDVTVMWRNGSTRHRVTTYGKAPEGQVVWLEGSAGLLELAINGGSAAAATGLGRRGVIEVVTAPNQ